MSEVSLIQLQKTQEGVMEEQNISSVDQRKEEIPPTMNNITLISKNRPQRKLPLKKNYSPANHARTLPSLSHRDSYSTAIEAEDVVYPLGSEPREISNNDAAFHARSDNKLRINLSAVEFNSESYQNQGYGSITDQMTRESLRNISVSKFANSKSIAGSLTLIKGQSLSQTPTSDSAVI